MRKLGFVLLIGAIQGMAAASHPAEAPRIEEIVKIDVHSHIFEPVPEFVAMMRRINLCIINICTRGTIPQWLPRAEALVEEAHRNFPDLFASASTFDVTRRDEENYHDQVRNWLDRSFATGAVMTKIWKEIGMEVRKPNGSFLMPDDPVFDPIYGHLRLRGKPLIATWGNPLKPGDRSTRTIPTTATTPNTPSGISTRRRGSPATRRSSPPATTFLKSTPT